MLKNILERLRVMIVIFFSCFGCLGWGLVAEVESVEC